MYNDVINNKLLVFIMKLYGSYTSPFVRHCRIVMELLNLECDFIEIDNAISAEKSPNKKVPFLHDGEVMLTDSTSILLHFYNKSNKSFITSSEDMDIYNMSNTLLDASINLFLLGMDGVTPETSQYLVRQASRIETGLEALENSNRLISDENNIASIRLFCFLDWGLFRKRINIENRPNLLAFMEKMNTYSVIQSTTPPA